MIERQNISQNPKRQNDGMAENHPESQKMEWPKVTQSQNSGKSHQILKDGTINPVLDFNYWALIPV